MMRSLPFLLMIGPALSFLPGRATADCWNQAPGHGQDGRPSHVTATALWDPDGAGPSGPELVAASVSGIEVWNGSHWSTVGGLGVTGEVQSLAVYNGQLYAAGDFQAIGSDAVSDLARWDGLHWEPPGTGLQEGAPVSYVRALQVYNGLLYVGGIFYPNDTGIATTCAAWNGAQWVATDVTQAPISDFTIFNGVLHASTLAGVPGVYRLGAQQWERLGTLADRSILCLAVYNSQLYAGGEFTYFFTGTNIRGIARWNGNAWVPLGAGMSPLSGDVKDLEVYAGSLVATGVFSSMDNVLAENIAAWNGVSFSALGGGLRATAYGHDGGMAQLLVQNGELVAAGHLDKAGGAPAKNIARWDGSQWLPFVEGLNGRVRVLFPAGGIMYVGGDFDFTTPQAVNIDHILSSDGITTASPLGSVLGPQQGTQGIVNAVSLHTFVKAQGPRTIVGGFFDFAGGVPVSNVALYGDFSSGWSALGAGFNSAVTCLTDFGSAIYAGGIFTASGVTPLSHIARYSSGNWIDPGMGALSSVYAMIGYAGKLVVGALPDADGLGAWNGTTFAPYGTANGPVFALTTFGPDLVAAGQFTSMDGQPVARIARRDSVTGLWSAMGAGFGNGDVYALTVHNGELFAGGTFADANPALPSYLARWNGSAWEPYSALDGPVYALASFKNSLQVGGDFGRAANFAASPYWMQDSLCVVSAERGPTVSRWSLGASYPNPTRRLAHVRVTFASAGPASLFIYDVAGRRIRTLVSGPFEAGEKIVTWDGRDDEGRESPAGVYFFRLLSESGAFSTRTVLLR